jgi:phosphoribosylanthranilate isomerase
VTDVKFCGMTRAADLQHAVTLGVRYVGCIFAGGPRQQTLPQAVALFDSMASGRTGRVGVFASSDPKALRVSVTAVGLNAVQLHDDPSAASLDAVRRSLGVEVWAVVRCSPSEALPAHAADIWTAADALVLDARVSGRLGGTGVPLDWSRLAAGVARLRHQAPGGRLVVAGGLTPENVGTAISHLQPDVVDVSSGIEYAPGKKDHARMEAFVHAVAEADRLL